MIRFDGLRAGYDGVERLHGVSCDLPKGQLTALIGPNGCGKSTLLKCAAGIVKPFGGLVSLSSRPYSEFDRRELARSVAYMPQSRTAPEMTVAQLAAHGRYPHQKWGRSLTAADREIIENSLIRAGVDGLADRVAASLSGGERQRAYLAMMLAQQTEVLLLDEPTTYLDLGGQFALMDMLLELRSEGKTVVTVLHDLALALECADHVLLMCDGRLVQTGAPEEIFASGSLGEVFGVEVDRIGERYVFSRRRNSEAK